MKVYDFPEKDSIMIIPEGCWCGTMLPFQVVDELIAELQRLKTERAQRIIDAVDPPRETVHSISGDDIA